MNPERFRQVYELYHVALELQPGERAELLAQADPELRREVESLLKQQGGGLLDRPAWEGAANLLADPTRTQFSPGAQLGPYRIEGPLGSGGMGEVYRAHDNKLGRDVAIKTLPPEFARDPERLARFRREARALASLNHPNIAAIYGLEESNQVECLVLELVEGETLAERIKRTGPLPVHTALDYARQIAEALEAAHGKGIIHRDLKPANVKVTPQGAVKVLDFGLATIARGRADAPDDPENSPTRTNSLSREGVILGTAAYMSPEQARGQAVDNRADIWAFGVVLFEMLTGRRLFEGNTTTEILAAVLTEEPDWDRVPEQVRPLLRSCLEKDPSSRCGSADKVQQELTALESSLALAGGAKRSRNTRIAVGIAVVLACVIAGWLWQRWSRERWVLHTAIPEIGRLMDSAEYIKAVALVRQAQVVLLRSKTPSGGQRQRSH